MLRSRIVGKGVGKASGVSVLSTLELRVLAFDYFDIGIIYSFGKRFVVFCRDVRHRGGVLATFENC